MPPADIPQKKILVRAPQWLGDAVVSTVFLSRLKSRFPESAIFVLCMPHLSEIFETHSAVDTVLKLPYPEENVFLAARTVEGQKFDAAYILPRSFRAALESFLAKIPRRIGYRGDLRRFLLTEALSYDPHLLYPHRYLKLIGEESFPLANVEPFFPAVEPTVAPVLKKPVLGLAPVSIAPSRTWMPERFAEVANRFQKERGGTVVLFGADRERDLTRQIQSAIKGPCIDTTGGLRLPELGWMIKRCDLLVANDSGLMHVAACFNVPTIVLFGASDPTYALPPWGKFISIQHDEIFCVPCLRNHCVRFGSDHNACLKAITVNEVVAAIDRQ